MLTKERGSLSPRSNLALSIVKEAIRLFGSCTDVPVTKDLLHALKHALSEYALFLENERKRELTEQEKWKREQAKEIQTAKEKTTGSS